MSNCVDYQNRILNEEKDNAIKEHIKDCADCKIFYDMMNSNLNEIEFTLPDELISKEIELAFETYEKSKRLKDLFSLFAFIVFSSIVLVSLTTVMINLPIKAIIKTSLTVSGLLPISLPLIIFFRKKKVLF